MRKRRGAIKRLPIELDLGDPAQARVWEYWQDLAGRGQAAAWGRQALVAALPVAGHAENQEMSFVGTDYRQTAGDNPEEPTYGPVDE